MTSKRVHLIGIGGSAMSNIAVMFAQKGWAVTGSDQGIYPPALDTLKQHKIDFFESFDASHIHSELDLVVIGNVVSAGHVEAQACLDQGMAYTSMAQALLKYFMRDKIRIGVSGTHGKSTTTTLLSWVFEYAGRKPSFFVGGIPSNFDYGFSLADGDAFIIEADEYDTAYFEKTPKFLHYDLQDIIVTSIEFDHADIYQNYEEIFKQFKGLIVSLPKDGHVILCVEDPRLLPLMDICPEVQTYGFDDADWTAKQLQHTSFGQSFDVFFKNVFFVNIQTHLLGKHNCLNILSAVAQAHRRGIAKQDIQGAIKSFKGLKKRQEIIGEKSNILVYTDFAHHPTAIEKTIEGFRPLAQARGGALWICFEPRSNTLRRNVFQSQLAHALQGADGVMIANVFQKNDRLPKSEQLNRDAIVKDLQKKNIQAFAPSSNTLMLSLLKDHVRSNDLVVFMSNGHFDNAPRNFLEML